VVHSYLNSVLSANRQTGPQSRIDDPDPARPCFQFPISQQSCGKECVANRGRSETRQDRRRRITERERENILKAAVVNSQFGPIITCKGQHIPVERFSVFLRQHLSSYRMHRTGKRASWGSASLVTFLSIAFISLALVFSEQASAQNSGNGAAPQPANPLASAESLFRFGKRPVDIEYQRF
jgi:hypothetical protein